jgi:hypothetical protein
VEVEVEVVHAVAVLLADPDVSTVPTLSSEEDDRCAMRLT